MFPIPFNFPFRKSNGAMTTIGDAISEGGGSYTLPTASADTKGGVKIGSGLSMSGEVLNATAELPAYSSATAGKVLTVDENGDLEWDTKGSGGGIYTSGVIRPTLYGPINNTKFKIGTLPNPPSKGSGLTIYSDDSYEISELIDFSIGNFIEMQNYMTPNILTALNATLIANVINSSTSVELSHPFTDYDIIILEGVYEPSGGTSGYDTCIIQGNTELNTPYWFGVKDRNNSYSGTITFVDSTHATLSASRRIRVYGFNL